MFWNCERTLTAFWRLAAILGWRLAPHVLQGLRMKSTTLQHREREQRDQIEARLVRELQELRHVEAVLQKTYAAAQKKPRAASSIARECWVLLRTLDMRTNRLEQAVEQIQPA